MAYRYEYSSPVRALGRNAPLIRFFISALYILFACLYRMLPEVPYGVWTRVKLQNHVLDKDPPPYMAIMGDISQPTVGGGLDIPQEVHF